MCNTLPLDHFDRPEIWVGADFDMKQAPRQNAPLPTSMAGPRGTALSDGMAALALQDAFPTLAQAATVAQPSRNDRRSMKAETNAIVVRNSARSGGAIGPDVAGGRGNSDAE